MQKLKIPGCKYLEKRVNLEGCVINDVLKTVWRASMIVHIVLVEQFYAQEIAVLTMSEHFLTVLMVRLKFI
jgi:hypothetical protein